MNGRRLLRIGAFLLFNVIVAVVVVEVVLAAAMAAPSMAGAMPRSVRVLFQQVYRHFNRSIIQFEPACAQSNPDLTYLLNRAGARSTTSNSAPNCASTQQVCATRRPPSRRRM